MILLSQPNKNRNSFYKFHTKYPNPTSLQTHCGPSEMTLNNILPVQFIRFSKFLPKNIKENQTNEKPGAHQMEPPSPIQALGVNPFPSRFIIRTVPRGDFARRRWEEPITTTKWHCYCTSSNSRKFVADRPNTIISLWNVTLAFSSLKDFLYFFFLAGRLYCGEF